VFALLGGVALLASAPTVAAQAGNPTGPAPMPTPRGTTASAPQLPGSSPLLGGVPSGRISAQPLVLSLDDAIARGLHYNLAVLLSSSATETARAQRYEALSALLPQISGGAYETEQKVSLAAFGIGALFPSAPPVIGPFRVVDARAYLHEPLSLSGFEGTRAAHAAENASRHSLQETRDLVVLAVANQYLLAVADRARVAAVQAELNTSEQNLRQATDMKAAGVVSAIDVVRANVQQESDKQRLIAAQNDLDKRTIGLARAIGIPEAQPLELTDTLPDAPMPVADANAAIATALATRPDYKAAQELVSAAEMALKGARYEHLPSVAFDANYGTIGNHTNFMLPTYALTGSISVPVFAGGRIRGDVMAAQARLREAENRAADLRAQIEQDVRNALLDTQASASQVQVAAKARDLAHQELQLAQDRFRAGIADNLEQVQAQQQVAAAEENYIASLYSYDAAKAALARALGVAESAYHRYLQGGQP
jgi:outer membrane protein TolC